jgi:hypothetical protein
MQQIIQGLSHAHLDKEFRIFLMLVRGTKLSLKEGVTKAVVYRLTSSSFFIAT